MANLIRSRFHFTDDDTLRNAAIHAFLPKKLPRCESGLEAAVEVDLLRCLELVLEDDAEGEDIPQTKRTIKTWASDVQPNLEKPWNAEVDKFPTPWESVRTVLAALNPGESLPAYIRSQNCTLFLTRLDDEWIRVITFRASLASEDVMSSSNDALKVSFPHSVDIVPRSDLLMSSSFARQLYYLHLESCAVAMPTSIKAGKQYAEVRDVSSPAVVADFVVSLLDPVNIEDYTRSMRKATSGLQMQKKIRDEINWGDGNIPFRRSGLWTSAKVVLHLSLFEELENDDDTAGVAYKSVILRTLTQICDMFEKQIGSTGENPYIMTDMLKKLARRARKLEDLHTSSEPWKNYKATTLMNVYKLIEDIQGKLVAEWTRVVTNPSKNLKKISRTPEEFLQDCRHTMPQLSSYLEQQHSPVSEALVDGLKEINGVTRCLSLQELLDREPQATGRGDVHLNEAAVWIYDCENFVIRSAIRLQLENCSALFTLLTRYSQKVVKLYGESRQDPVAFSTMTLVLLAIIKGLDQIAVKAHPLLTEYHSGIDSEDFASLLLPCKSDMVLLHDVLDYFRRRNTTAKHRHGLVTPSTPNASTFPVNYAQNDGAMTSLWKQILADTEAAEKQKIEVVRKAKEECYEMQRRISSTKCEHTWNSYYKEWIHISPCNHCSYESTLKGLRTSVGIYERPLPPESFLQLAVVFELMIPVELAVLRDSLCLFLGEVCGRTLFGNKKRENIYIEWQDYTGVYSYVKKRNATVTSGFGSHAKPTSVTHYGRDAHPDVLNSSEDRFIENNGLHCEYFTNPILGFKRSEWDVYTYQLKNAKESKPYQNLQDFMKANTSSENRILANQYQCHGSLQLKEFISFGSLRCGHRIQLRNLYAVISGQRLSFHSEAVLALTLQTIWELGPTTTLAIVWDSHEDLTTNINFSMEFLELLKTFVESNSSNWSSPLVMLTAVVLIIRILELNENPEVRQTCMRLLKQCRQTFHSWIIKLDELIIKAEKADKEEKQMLLELILLACVCLMYTFDVKNEHLFPFVVTDQTDVQHWLEGVSKMHYLVIREKANQKLSKFMANILHHARLTIPLNLLESLHLKISEKISTDECGLHVFAMEYLGLVETSSFKTFSWQRCTGSISKDHAYVGTYSMKSLEGPPQLKVIHLDILHGAVLVNGFPLSHLPESMIRHPLFESWFLTSHFQVERNGGRFTANNFCGHKYEFFQNEGDNNQLVIRQLHDDHFLELLPNSLFESQLCNHLRVNYTHWYHSVGKQVHFRRKPVPSDNYRNQNMNEFTLYKDPEQPSNFLVRSNKTSSHSKFVVSIKSNGYAQILTNLHRLEGHEYIDVFAEGKEDNERVHGIFVNLRRLKLSFKLEHGALHSMDLPGYFAPLQQNFGTLVGITSGLLLESNRVIQADGRAKRMFLIQNGEIVNSTSYDRHQTTTVIVNDSKSKLPYFSYEIDDILQRLKASNDKCAWLYLAALHAATSSPHPDPFTGQTGAEMAMWILKSGFVWSGSPYDAGCRQVLERIRRFSPRRVYYPPHLEVMQVTTWPKGLEANSYAAYDGYEIIVKQLLHDSRRLEGLFPSECQQQDDEDDGKQSSEKLRKRSYNRNVSTYNSSMKVLCMDSTSIEDDLVYVERNDNLLDSSGVRKLAHIRIQEGPVIKPSSLKSLSKLLLITDELHHGIRDNLSPNSVPEWLLLDLRPCWLRLYNLAWSAKKEHFRRHDFTFILGALLYTTGNQSMDNILTLHNISELVRQGQASFPKVITSKMDFHPTNHSFVKRDIEKILNDAKKSYPTSGDAFPTYDAYQTAKRQYDNESDCQVRNVAASLANLWPRENIPYWDLQNIFRNNGRQLQYSQDVHEAINKKLGFWFNNLSFRNFVLEVEDVLQAVKYDDISTENCPKISNVSYVFCTVTSTFIPKFPLELVQAAENNIDHFFQTLALANEVFTSGNWCSSSLFYSKQGRLCLELVEKLNRVLDQFVAYHPTIRVLSRVGLYTRTSPLSLLRLILNNEGLKDHFGGEEVPCHFVTFGGALAVLYSQLQRLNRILKYQQLGDSFQLELDREEESQNFEGWSPKENVEWLLLQLELDLAIRPVQLRVAKHMMDMSGGISGLEKSGVMQLNMGEGKTSVIVPMIVATMAKNRDMLCRVTVLSSIYETNFSLLTFTLGGLLNKRLYTIPCNRKLTRIGSYLNTIQEVYAECLQLQGVVMTLPEYRLSFKLMACDNFLHSKATPKAQKFYAIESWLKAHARDIVDESDEVFSVKYQLIYTTGKQIKLDRDKLRWEVCQKLLEILPSVATQLLKKYGDEAVEIDEKGFKKHPERFSPIRVLSEACKNDLNELMAEAILEGRGNLLGAILDDERKRQLVKAFMIDDTISKKDHTEALEVYGTAECQNTLLILAGYLRYSVLYTALTKRWRVDAGVSKREGGMKMSVPFRAKDVAAERTEFGHPDIAIVLTQLSYYYSGLSDLQLEECFKILDKTTGAASLYRGWIEKVQRKKEVHPSIQQLGGINLVDYEQRTQHLFPILRRHKQVIDFWLDHIVFPQESKQFPGKLVTTAWDLCCKSYQHPVTGFSGTNDTSLLLPGNIQQQDLEELKQTNQQLEATLSRVENNMKGRSLEAGVTSQSILEYLVLDGLQVLVDGGALVLQLSNEQVARKWLELDDQCEAVIYFGDKSNKLMVKTRTALEDEDRLGGDIAGEFDIPLKLSPYGNILNHGCRVYLDDQHSRGTDLKMPTDFKACVTVGSKMKRDKLFQACMRMRKLGKGQSVHFYLSHEVDSKIRKMTEERGGPCGEGGIRTKDILEWVTGNSKQFEKDGLWYWALSGKNYAQKLAAEKAFSLMNREVTEAGAEFGERCQDAEVLKLEEMYGTWRTQEKAVALIPKLFSGVKRKLKEVENARVLAPEVEQIVDETRALVERRCGEHIPNVEFTTSLVDEEQEKELEPENEREEEVERPPAETPITPRLHENVREFALRGGGLRMKEGIMDLGRVFENTSFWETIQPESWGGRVYASEDFTRVIEFRRTEKLDCFLRPLSYLVSWEGNERQDNYVLILSMFEANALIPEFRKCSGNSSRGTRLHMITGRSFVGQDILVNNTRLQLPSLPGGGKDAGITLPQNVVTPMLISGGNLFFSSNREQESFAKFLGLHPRPWMEGEVERLRGKITETGFVLPKFRKEIMARGVNDDDEEVGAFLNDPTQMVVAILECRNDALRETNHSLQILRQHAYIPDLNKE